MKRTCTKCGEEKDLSGFHKHKKGLYGVHERCKVCRGEERRQHYIDNKSEILLKEKHHYNKKRQWMDDQKKPCIICGEAEKVCIDFHHLDPKEKDFTIGANSRKTKDALQKEIDKCVCLCANCHRKVHAGLIDLSAYATTT